MFQGYGRLVVISKLAVVQTDVLGANVSIAEFSVVREGVRIGNDVVIHPHVVIESGVEIGDGVEIFPGAYLGKEPKGAGILIRQPSFERRITVGAHCQIGPNAVIFYDVSIGENTLLGDGVTVREQCRIGSRCIISHYVCISYNTVIGDRTRVMDLAIVTGNCNIGSDVFISLNVGTFNDREIGRAGYDEERVVGPRIEDGAVVGAGAILGAGVTVGRGAMVGAASLVTRDVEPFTYVMGTPARLVQRFDPPLEQ